MEWFLRIWLLEEVENGGNNDWGNYEIPTETNLKEYYIKEENYEGVFGTGKVIVPVEGISGKNRFYVMALKDINPGTGHYWYKAASGKLDNIVSESTNDFGQGITNTKYAMTKWNDSSLPWGNHNNLDMWGKIENEISAGWFVPSKSEWAAFGVALKINTNNFANYGLSGWYWSSSTRSTYDACAPYFNDGEIIYRNVNDNGGYVRLCTTF